MCEVSSWSLMFATALFLVSKGATRGSAIRLYRVDRSAWRRPIRHPTLWWRRWFRPSICELIPRQGAVTAGTIRPDGRVVALRTYTEIYLFYPGVGGRLLPARERPCNIAGLEIGGEAIDFLDDSTFVLTSEAGRSRPGTIDTVKCRLSPEQPTQ